MHIYIYIYIYIYGPLFRVSRLRREAVPSLGLGASPARHVGSRSHANRTCIAITRAICIYVITTTMIIIINTIVTILCIMLGLRPARVGARAGRRRAPEGGGMCACIYLSIYLSIHLSLYIHIYIYIYIYTGSRATRARAAGLRTSARRGGCAAGLSTKKSAGTLEP